MKLRDSIFVLALLLDDRLAARLRVLADEGADLLELQRINDNCLRHRRPVR